MPAGAPTSRTNQPDPCRDRPWETIVDEWKTIAGWIGWGILETGVAGPDVEHQSFTDIERNLGKNGFRPFPWYKPNLNREHNNGFHYEGLLRANHWYHVVVYPARDSAESVAEDFRSRPASAIEIHCERGFRRPSSIRHALDVLLSKDYW